MSDLIICTFIRAQDVIKYIAFVYIFFMFPNVRSLLETPTCVLLSLRFILLVGLFLYFSVIYKNQSHRSQCKNSALL